MKIDLPLDGLSRQRLRDFSRTVFGSQYALEILLHIAQEDRFYQGGLVEVVPGVKGSFLKGHLERLESQGLIEREPRPAGPSREYFHRLSSPLWPYSLGLASALLTSKPDTDAPATHGVSNRRVGQPPAVAQASGSG